MFFATLSEERAILSSTKMQVRVDVDDHIDGSEELMVRVEGVVEGSLDRFLERIARVDVHLSQLDRRHASHGDMCCRIEAYAGALSPIVVSHEALTLTEAIHAAAAKLHRAVAAALGRRPGGRNAASGVDGHVDGAPEEGLEHARSS
jgi:ribosome-associated translation inhibitor RaiA